MRIKPFLTISDVKSDSVVLGVTKRFRTDVPLPIDTHDYKRELLVRAINADETIGNRLAELGLLINDEPYVERDSRTLSFLSLFTDSPLAKLAELRKQKILVAGCGGLGSRIVLELASL